MIIVIESIVLCLIFTLMVYLMSREPIKTLYDNLRIVIPRGRKAEINAYAKKRGLSTNALVNLLLRQELGIDELLSKVMKNGLKYGFPACLFPIAKQSGQ